DGIRDLIVTGVQTCAFRSRTRAPCRPGGSPSGMVCNVVTFQPRMAIRQVGKALGFSAELLDRLAKGVDRWFTEDVEDSMTGAVQIGRAAGRERVEVGVGDV